MKTSGTKIAIRAGFLIACGFSFCAYSQEADCKLNQQEKTILKDSFIDWKLVTIDSLRDEDKVFWKKYKKNACPGMVLGHFINSTAKTKIISMFLESNNQIDQAVIAFFPENKSGKRYQILDRFENVAFLSVLALTNDKNLVDSEGKKIKLGHEAVVYEALESGKIIFYFDKNWEKYYFD